MWIWISVVAYLVGLVFDAVWHGLLNPDFEATTFAEMVWHLSTVHLPIYIGAVAVFGATVWTLADRQKHSRSGLALPIALVGAFVVVAGEAWHAWSHLQLSTHSGPLAAATAFLGLVIVVVATWLDGRRRRQRRSDAAGERRAA